MPKAELSGGAETALMEMLRSSESKRIEWIVVFQVLGGMVDRVRSLGIAALVVHGGRVRQFHRLLWSVMRIVQIASQNCVDLILSWEGKAHLYGGPAAILSGIPAVWVSHASVSHWNPVDRLTMRIPAAGICACSRSVASSFDIMVPRRPVRIVNPGVDIIRFNAQDLPERAVVRQMFGIEASRPLLVSVGRLVKAKGFDLLISAMPSVLKHFPEARCLILGGEDVGEPGYRSMLERQIDDHGLSSRVLLMGLQADIPRWLHLADVVVQASRLESFGLSIVEAMAMGKPVVAAAASGPREIIDSGVNGILVPVNDVKRIGSAIVCLLKDRALAERIGEAAIRRARRFSSSCFAEDLVRALAEFG